MIGPSSKPRPIWRPINQQSDGPYAQPTNSATRLPGSSAAAAAATATAMDTAIFSPSSLFHGGGDDENGENASTAGEAENGSEETNYVERAHRFPGMELIIREFSFHRANANLLWPGTFAFAEWLVANRRRVEGRQILELGSGTGALAIFMKKSFEVDITTSDLDDMEVEENISYNCEVNGLSILPHVRHTWGETFPISHSCWDLIIASDILLYVKQYPNLIRTLSFLLNSYKPEDGKPIQLIGNDATISETGLPWPAFLMSWRRRIGKEDEALFFRGCEDADLHIRHLGSRVYCISPRGAVTEQK